MIFLMRLTASSMLPELQSRVSPAVTASRSQQKVECEAGETGELAGVDFVNPGGECGAEAVGEYLAEVADVSGGLVQFWAAG
ncbi:hypothetical protein [Streptomyces sp. NRRL S-87]|uniref:hypothetical protein n=1 Tax=Streptomyces sp. NRRL S-87 TaxID=1463920 RepID=UPI0004BF79D5|nr:hypothetical protein [Streptomyces sp. NRRL S-87]